MGQIIVYVKTLTGKALEIKVDVNETVENLKGKNTSIRKDFLQISRDLIFAGYLAWKTGGYCSIMGFVIKVPVHLVLRLRGGGEGPFTVTVRFFKTLYFYDINGRGIHTIRDLKARIEELESYPVESLRLSLDGRVLNDNYALRQNLELDLAIQ